METLRGPFQHSTVTVRNHKNRFNNLIQGAVSRNLSNFTQWVLTPNLVKQK